MLQAFSTSHNRRISSIFLAVSIVSLIGAFVIGIDDNLPGISFAMLAALAALLAFVHPWRTETPFRYMLWGALAAIVPCGILHGILESLASNSQPGSVSQLGAQLLAVVLFCLAVFVVPPAFLIGLLGSVIMSIRGRRKRLDSPGSPA